MRSLSFSTLMLLGVTAVASAQEGGAAPAGGGLMSIQVNLMFWTLIIFLLVFFILAKFAFKPITAAVEAREKALEEAIEGARRDREAAATLLREHQASIELARNEAQKMIGDARSTGEKVRAEMVEETRKEQQDMLDRARREIDTEKTRAIADMRKEAVELALAAASKVIEQNLSNDNNRKLVETYLSQLGTLKVTQ